MFKKFYYNNFALKLKYYSKFYFKMSNFINFQKKKNKKNIRVKKICYKQYFFSYLYIINFFSFKKIYINIQFFQETSFKK